MPYEAEAPEPTSPSSPLPLPASSRDAGEGEIHRTVDRRGGLVFRAGYVVGRSPEMQRIYRELAVATAGPIPVLLVGETGVGKEHLARLLHDSSPRHGGPFLALNCAAIPADLLEAELFGVREGTATGVRASRGCFREAHGGTLFLDEVGEMPSGMQAKLLRALQEKEVRPVGGLPVPVDVRIVSATNADLERQRREGRFRDDLYYRLAGLLVRVPPLRERREDVPPLVRHFVRRFAAEVDRRIRGVSEAALDALVDAPWPGNVRQLEHEVRRLVYLAPEGGEIGPELLSPQVVAAEVAALGDSGDGLTGDADSPASLNLEEHTARLERRLIRLALHRTRGGIAPAARLLGISRNGLKMKCERLGVPL